MSQRQFQFYFSLFLFSIPAFALEEKIRLKDSPGRNLVVTHCSAYHSTDYIIMNSPFLDKKGWEASLHKMTKVMGASIAEKDSVVILDYLVKNYGAISGADPIGR